MRTGRHIGVYVRGEKSLDAATNNASSDFTGFFLDHEDEGEEAYCADERYCEIIENEFNSVTGVRPFSWVQLQWNVSQAVLGNPPEEIYKEFDTRNLAGDMWWFKDKQLSVFAQHLVRSQQVPAYVFSQPNSYTASYNPPEFLRERTRQLFDWLASNGYASQVRGLVCVNEGLQAGPKGNCYQDESNYFYGVDCDNMSIDEEGGESTYKVPNELGFCDLANDTQMDINLATKYDYSYNRTPVTDEESPRYLVDAFTFARQYAIEKGMHEIKLWYADWGADSTFDIYDGARRNVNLEYPKRWKADRLLRLAKFLSCQQHYYDPPDGPPVPILDGICLQMHIHLQRLFLPGDETHNPPGDETVSNHAAEIPTMSRLANFVAGIEEQINRIQDLGLKVAISEMDVETYMPPDEENNILPIENAGNGYANSEYDWYRSLSDAQRRKCEAKVFYEVIQAINRAGVDIDENGDTVLPDLTIWGVTDRYSWHQGLWKMPNPTEGEYAFEHVLYDSLGNGVYERKEYVYEKVREALAHPNY